MAGPFIYTQSRFIGAAIVRCWVWQSITDRQTQCFKEEEEDFVSFYCFRIKFSILYFIVAIFRRVCSLPGMAIFTDRQTQRLRKKLLVFI
ncbi:MAG: hypothetical protein WC765_09770 [Phycisphaerae bacterium]